MRTLPLLVLALAACGGGSSSQDLGGQDQAAPVDGAADLAPYCGPVAGPIMLREDQCPGGTGICFLDYQTTDFF